MGFLESYKQLEKLCGEVSNDDRRVSAYIDEMLNTPNGSYLVSGWNNDLKQLKHYRWVRNKITHEPNCTEENMCKPGDTEWINDFHSRIINQTDPLALYAKATKPKPVKKPTQTYNRNDNTYYESVNNNKSSSKAIGCIAFMIFMLILIATIALVSKALYY